MPYDLDSWPRVSGVAQAGSLASAAVRQLQAAGVAQAGATASWAVIGVSGESDVFDNFRIDSDGNYLMDDLGQPSLWA